MSRTWWRMLVGLLWLAPVVMALRYRSVWDQLPARIASHFDAAGRANGWMPREASFYFTIGFLSFLALVFSVSLFAIHRRYPVGRLSLALLAFFHIELWTVVYMLNSTIDYNLTGAPIIVAPLMVFTPLGIIALLAIAFTERRGDRLPATELVAEEVHSGKTWALLFLLPLVVCAPAALAVPNANFRVGASILCIVFLAVFAMAWDGFHYYFTRHGVEIRSLGFRLKSIPLGQIKQYAVQSWRPMCGYGIRGMGNHKAYVWGNRGVRVEMYDGDIFLGHNEPEKIVRDLDLIRQYSHS